MSSVAREEDKPYRDDDVRAEDDTAKAQFFKYYFEIILVLGAL